ncbi:hypothetical protein D3C84_972570 [compost metagenome]
MRDRVVKVLVATFAEKGYDPIKIASRQLCGVGHASFKQGIVKPPDGNIVGRDHRKLQVPGALQIHNQGLAKILESAGEWSLRRGGIACLL